MIGSQCVLCCVRKSICHLVAYFMKRGFLPRIRFPRGRVKRFGPFKNSLKKLHFPTVFILSLPTLLLLVKQNTVYEEVWREKNACLLGWLFKKNQMFGLYCLRLVFLITDASSSLWAREAKRCRKTRNLSFSSRFFLRFISFGKVFCCVLNQRQLYFTGQKWAF